MNKYSFELNGKTYCRVSKRSARKLFEAGAELYACPCNLRPGKPWHPEAYICREMAFPYVGTFDSVVNYIAGVNCINGETGRYLAYYAKEDM